MAETASEYKDRLLRTLSGDAAISERNAAFYEQELPYAETQKIAEVMQSKRDEAAALATFLRAAAVALEDVDAGL